MMNFLAGLGNFRFNKRQQQRKVLIELFQKFAELETASRFNARPSGLATALQNREALLLDFGQSQYFPNVGKYCALSLRALCRARIFTLFFLSNNSSDNRNRDRDSTDEVCRPINEGIHHKPIEHSPGFDSHFVEAQNKRKDERYDADYQ